MFYYCHWRKFHKAKNKLKLKKITEQAKFTYSPLDKAFEKQTKAIENQRKKQVEAIEEHGKQQISQKYKVLHTTQDKIFNDLINERMENIENLNNYVNFKYLIYYHNNTIRNIDFRSKNFF